MRVDIRNGVMVLFADEREELTKIEVWSKDTIRKDRSIVIVHEYQHREERRHGANV